MIRKIVIALRHLGHFVVAFLAVGPIPVRGSRYCLLLLVCFCAMAQEPANETPAEPERWNLYYQATSIGQYHGTFNSPYAGSVQSAGLSGARCFSDDDAVPGAEASPNTQLYFDPEIAGGRGFSGVTAGEPFNGELPRVASATPKPYLASLYITHDFGFGGERESFDSDENQLAGDRPRTRYTIAVGRFSLTDFFDDNRYTHDPRTQFMGWAVMYNGAWDYPADMRGYTWGWVHEFHTRNWSLRYGSAAEPRVANGPQLDRRFWRTMAMSMRSSTSGNLGGHPGAVRILGYDNHADAVTMLRPFAREKERR